MILHRLLLEDFRGVRREEVRFPDTGVTVVEGPNESGKTSLVDGLHMLLEHKASSTKAGVRAAAPVGRDVPVVVEAEFTIDGTRMRYRKEFVRGKKTVLEFPGSTRPALTADDAHDEVRRLLDTEVDWPLWSALRVDQDSPAAQVAGAGDSDSLRRALDAAAGGADPTGDDSLLERVRQERERYLTAARGEPTGELARARDRLAAAREERDRARAGVDEHEGAVAAFATAESAHRVRADALVTAQAELDRLEKAHEAAAGLRADLREKEATAERASTAEETARRLLGERRDLTKDAEDAAGRAERLAGASADVDARLADATTGARSAREALRAAEDAADRARTRVERARRRRERERARDELASLTDTLAALEKVEADLERVEADRESVRITQEAVDAIRGAADAARSAEARLTAGAPVLEIGGRGEARIDGEAIDAAAGWRTSVVDPTTVSVGDVDLTVSPSGDSTAARDDARRARERADALLADAGVATPAEADERLRRYRELGVEADALRGRRGDLLGRSTAAELAARRDSLTAELAVEDEPGDDEVAGDPGDPADAVREAEAAVAAARAAEGEAAAILNGCSSEQAVHAARLADAREAADALAARVATARRENTDDALAAALETAEDARESAHREHVEARRLLDEALADAPADLLENARASVASLREEERRAADEVSTIKGVVSHLGDQGLLERSELAEREYDSAERDDAALWRRARAADLLHRTLTERRAEAMRGYQEPFHRAVVDLGRLVYGRDFDVELAEDLTITSRRLGDETVPYSSLSGGAREQLALIVRVACARIVGSDGVPVFLDDTLGFTDPTRRFAMGAVLAAAGESTQVVVLTCDRARFAGIGGARSHVMGTVLDEEG